MWLTCTAGTPAHLNHLLLVFDPTEYHAELYFCLETKKMREEARENKPQRKGHSRPLRKPKVIIHTNHNARRRTFGDLGCAMFCIDAMNLSSSLVHSGSSSLHAREETRTWKHDGWKRIVFPLHLWGGGRGGVTVSFTYPRFSPAVPSCFGTSTSRFFVSSIFIFFDFTNAVLLPDTPPCLALHTPSHSPSFTNLQQFVCSHFNLAMGQTR